MQEKQTQKVVNIGEYRAENVRSIEDIEKGIDDLFIATMIL